MGNVVEIDSRALEDAADIPDTRALNQDLGALYGELEALESDFNRLDDFPDVDRAVGATLHRISAGSVAAYAERTGTVLRVILITAAASERAAEISRTTAIERFHEIADVRNKTITSIGLSASDALGKFDSLAATDALAVVEVLDAKFNVAIESQRAARERETRQQYLEFAAYHDPLTHLPNRLMFDSNLKQTVRESIDSNLKFAVFLIDLGNLRIINNQFGHLVGKKLIAEVGNRLRAMVRDIDLVARLDGDEFVVIHKNLQDVKSVEVVAQKIISLASAPYEYRGIALQAEVSLGVSCFPDDSQIQQDDENFGEEILNNAAVALVEANNSGKNQYHQFNDNLRFMLMKRVELEHDLKVAIQEKQFEIYYQPMINLNTRHCIGAEALVRWRHPVNGHIPPDAFIPVAEETGLIVELGEWILQNACRDTYKLHRNGYPEISVSVNISVVEFMDGNLLPLVGEALKESPMSPELLELEITETTLMQDPGDVMRRMHELNERGVKLAIDDFGTGYTSLAYLKRLPITTLKIDRSFITDIAIESDDVAVVTGLLELGKHFGMKIVAEGVEDENQFELLQTRGCDIAQGYYICKPLNICQYYQWLDQWTNK